jgi:hypothetical protein
MASKADIAERLSPADAADDYLEKPFFLKDATRRIKRTIDRIALEKMAKTAPKDGVVRGSLAQMNVIDLMQSLEMGRKSCQLSLSNEGDKCEVFFAEGQVKHATYGRWLVTRLCSKSALDRWKFPARFRRQDRQRDHATQHAGTADGGLRLLDESSRDGGAEPEPEAAPVETAPPPRVQSDSEPTPSSPRSRDSKGRRGRCPPRWLRQDG